MDPEQVRQENSKLFSERAMFWIELANRYLFEINKQLIGLAIIILPLTASIVTIQGLVLREYEKTLLFGGWIFLLMSIIAGFIQMIVDTRYFVYLSRDSSRRSEIWSHVGRSVDRMQAETDELGKTRDASTHVPLYFQVFNLSLGLLFIIIVAISLLFAK